MRLQSLTPLLDRPGPWASVYVDVSRATEDAAHRLELQARQVGDRLAEQGADERTRRAAQSAMSDAGPDEPGLAVFAADGEVVRAVPLATAPPAPVIRWAALPHLAPLLGLGGEEPPTLVAYVDRTGADLELRDRPGGRPGGSRLVRRVEGRDWPVHRTGRDDWSERHWQFSVENTWEENAARIAEEVAAEADESHPGVVVLVGEARMRRAVHDRLPEQLREVAVEAAHGGRASGSASARLEEEIEEAAGDRARARREGPLERFRAGRVPKEGRVDAVEGLGPLAEAAREHRIDTLFVRDGGADLHRSLWVGPEPAQLAVRRTDVQQLGDADPTEAEAADALLRAALATGAEAVPLPPPDEAEDDDLPVGGLGALLRWPYEDGVPGGGLRPAS